MGWLTDRQLLDAVVAGQATPGPVFTTATFIGYLLGGPMTAVWATVGMFLPAFVCSAISAAFLDRLRSSATARAFLGGVNAAAVALIAMVVVRLGISVLRGPWPIALAVIAAVLVFVVRVGPSPVLAGGAIAGAVHEAMS